MARSQRQVPDVYFGRPGKLVSLPWPVNGIEKPTERQTYDFLTGSGLHQVSTLAAVSRPYMLSWNALYEEKFNLLDQHRSGLNGPGPWALIDPSAFNILPPNVAGATGLLRDATDLLTETDSGTPSSNADATFIHRTTGDRSIRWLFPSATIAANPVLYVRTPFRNWTGLPVAPGLSYAFSSWVRVDGTVETSANLAMQMRWFNAAGGALTTSASSTVSVTSAWQRISVVAVAPAGAAFVRPAWQAVGSTLIQNGAIYIDEPMLEQDTVVNDWAPGSGIRPVEITNLTETVPFEARFRTPVQMSLREISR